LIAAATGKRKLGLKAIIRPENMPADILAIPEKKSTIPDTLDKQSVFVFT